MGLQEDTSKSVDSAMSHVEQSASVDHGPTSQNFNDSEACLCQSSNSMKQFQAAKSEPNNKDSSSESCWSEDDLDTPSADETLQHDSKQIKQCFNEQRSERRQVGHACTS